MAIDRRQFLALGASALAGYSSGALAGNIIEADGAVFASAAKLEDGRYAVVIVTAAGELLDTIPLAGRGHDVTVSPAGNLAVAFARRPGTFALAFDTKRLKPPVLFHSPDDRHFYGHGVFSPDGRLLYATENDYENARGVLGVYDVAAGYRRIGELDTHGTGPHDLQLLSDGRTICIANGGIETHPAAGRAKLNLATMQPSIVFIDRETGDVIARHEVAADLHQLSLRHMCLDANGRAWVGGQWQGSMDQAPMLMAHVSRDKPITYCEAEPTFGPSLNGYIGSVTANADGRFIAASAPRAGTTIFIDAESGKILGRRKIKDGCGIAAQGKDGFLISSGTGELLETGHGGKGDQIRKLPRIAFDNHMLRILNAKS